MKVYYDKVMRSGDGDRYLHDYVTDLYLKWRITDGLCDLLQNMLLFDVRKRFNCQQILQHSWLNSIS